MSIRTRIALGLGIVLIGVAPALAEEIRIKSRAYEITSDLTREELDVFVRRMDLVASEYARRFTSFQSRDSRASILRLYRTNEAYLHHLAEEGLDGSNTAGVFYVGSHTFPTLAAWIEGNPRGRLFHVLQHEGFHQFLHSRVGGTVPIWANEGLAEYFGYALEVRGKLKTGIAPPSVIHSIQTAVTENKVFTFGEFIRMSDDEWGRRVTMGDARAGIMYDQAWSIAHFLIHGDNGKYADRFQAFLKETGNGRTVDQALEAAFGSSDVSAFEKAWRQYVGALEPDPIATAVERLEFLGEGLAALHEADVHPASIDELKNLLIESKFRMIVPTHASMRIIKAEDSSLYAAPPSPKGAPASITLEPAPAVEKRKGKAKPVDPNADAGSALPPDVVITGQPVEIRLTWFLGAEGKPEHEVIFR